jgi:hypothetical protein
MEIFKLPMRSEQGGEPLLKTIHFNLTWLNDIQPASLQPSTLISTAEYASNAKSDTSDKSLITSTNF